MYFIGSSSNYQKYFRQHCNEVDLDNYESKLSDEQDSNLIIFSDIETLDFYRKVRNDFPYCKLICFTTTPKKDFINFTDLIIYNSKEISLNEFIINSTLTKIKSFDKQKKFFQQSDMVYKEFDVISSKDRGNLVESLLDFCRFYYPKGPLLKKISPICEELMTNVLYDAPLETARVDPKRFARKNQVDLLAHEQAKMFIGINEDFIHLGTFDPWGSFKPESFKFYISKLFYESGHNDLIDLKESGAGLGLFKIVHYSQAFVCRVRKDRFTETNVLLCKNNHFKDEGKTNKTFGFLTID